MKIIQLILWKIYYSNIYSYKHNKLIFLKRKKYTKLADESLVEMTANDDANALNELFNRYSLLVMGIGLKYLKNKESAEDMTLELFVKIPEKLKKYEVKKFRSWLHTTARNECLMILRKKSPEISEGEVLGNIPAESENEFKIEKEAEYTQLEQAMNLLKPAQKKCIELFYYKKKCYEEIAAMTSFSIKEVKSHLQNGKRNLKIKIQESDE